MDQRILLSASQTGYDSYAQALRLVGGAPQGGYCPQVDLSCAGLILCGGVDIEPHRYGQGFAGTEEVDAARDEAEFALARAFLAAGRPVLGLSLIHIFSTHIIEEAANVFEKVIIMKEGAIAEVAETESFVASFSFVSGKDEDVAAVCAQLGASKVLHTEHFGRQTGVALRASLAAAQQAAAGRDVDVSPVNLQKAFVYLAGEKEDAPC